MSASAFHGNAFYEDAEGRLWHWTRVSGFHPFAWFPCASTGPGIVPSPVEPMRLVYDDRGVRVARGLTSQARADIDACDEDD